MAQTGIPRIDTLFESTVAAPLHSGNAEGQEAAVGIVQELLTCQGYTRLPNVRQIGIYGRFGPRTKKHLKDFRLKHNLQKPTDEPQVDHWTLHRLALEPAASPRASRGYLALALDVRMTGLMKVLSFVTLAEGAGKFAAFNENTDGQGLSYGLIQWAQRPGRLREIVGAFRDSQPVLFNGIFGGGANEMIAHTAKVKGGVNYNSADPKDPTNGTTTDENFNLIRPPWKERFANASLSVPLQKIQVEIARQAFAAQIASLRTYATNIRSERGFAFMIDLGNQHGISGAQSVYQAVVTAAVTEDEALAKVADESHRRVRNQYGEGSAEERGTRERRDFFRTTTLLSTADFNEN